MHSRAFLFLSALMGVIFLAGVSSIILLLASNQGDDEYIVTYPPLINPTQVNRLQQTETAAASFPYDPELYATRQKMMIDIAISFGPPEHHIWQMTETALVSTYQGTPGPLPTYTPSITPTPSMTLTPLSDMECTWTWATQLLPDVKAEFQTELDNLESFADYEVRALVNVFGENCLDSESKINHFAAMQTEFNVDVYDLTEAATSDDIAAMVADMLPILEAYPIDETPGPLPGEILLSFHGAEGSSFEFTRLLFKYDVGMAALGQNLTGQALLDALSEAS